MTVNPSWTPPPPPETPHRRGLGRLPRLALAGGVAAGLALGGAGIAFAASSTSSTTTPSNGSSSASTVPGPRAHGPLGRKGMGRMFGLGGNVLHGQATIRTPGGTTKTVEYQAGTVTSVSASSISVKSSDGYPHTYAVVPSTVVEAQRDGISSVKTTDSVLVMATTVSGTDTATMVVDTTQVGNSRHGFGFAKPAGSAAAGLPGMGLGRGGFLPGFGGDGAPVAPAAPAAQANGAAVQIQ